jgi:hypothetical protein
MEACSDGHEPVETAWTRDPGARRKIRFVGARAPRITVLPLRAEDLESCVRP